MFSQLLVPTLMTVLLLNGCSKAGQDSLARERASMDSEAKAMKAHDSKPGMSVERPGPTPPRHDVKSGTRLPAGTPIKVIITQSLSTRSANTGDEWAGKLSVDLKDPAGNVLAQAGSDVKGRVLLASDGSQLRRKHELELRVYRIVKTVKGEPLDIRTVTFVQEGQDRGARPAIVEANTKIDFQLASETVFP